MRDQDCSQLHLGELLPNAPGGLVLAERWSLTGRLGPTGSGGCNNGPIVDDGPERQAAT